MKKQHKYLKSKSRIPSPSCCRISSLFLSLSLSLSNASPLLHHPRPPSFLCLYLSFSLSLVLPPIFLHPLPPTPSSSDLPPPLPSASQTDPPLCRPESWHTRTVRKNRGSHLRICLTFWILLFALIAIVVVVFLVLIKTGVFNKIHIGGEGHKVDVGGFQGWLNRIFGTGGSGGGGGGDSTSGSGSGSDGSSENARRRLSRA